VRQVELFSRKFRSLVPRGVVQRFD
jgi:hypothetical protein